MTQYMPCAVLRIPRASFSVPLCVYHVLMISSNEQPVKQKDHRSGLSFKRCRLRLRLLCCKGPRIACINEYQDQQPRKAQCFRVTEHHHTFKQHREAYCFVLVATPLASPANKRRSREHQCSDNQDPEQRLRFAFVVGEHKACDREEACRQTGNYLANGTLLCSRHLDRSCGRELARSSFCFRLCHRYRLAFRCSLLQQLFRFTLCAATDCIRSHRQLLFRVCVDRRNVLCRCIHLRFPLFVYHVPIVGSFETWCKH